MSETATTTNKPGGTVHPMVMASPPNPGSDAALEMGCKCPVLDNGHGKGSGPFWITEGCPVHDTPPPCSVCGCTGNISCGRTEPLDLANLCTLNQSLVCPCCDADH